MTLRCARCDWRGEDDEAAEAHARESGHLRCIVCQCRFLNKFEQQTCGECVGALRADLADIVQAWCELEPVTVDALTLLGDGTMQRLMREDELSSLYPKAHPLAKAGDTPPRPIRDEWSNDPFPVIATLASWEDFIREHYKDPKGPPDPTLTQVTDYLMSNLDTGHNAAQTFPAFDEFAQTVRHLLTTTKHAAGLADDPMAAKAECFDCGGPLLRTYAPAAVPIDKRRNRAQRAAATVLTATKRQREAERSYGLSDLSPWPTTAARREARAALVGTEDEGLVDTWTCGWCRRVYSQTDYFIGLRVASSAWVPVPLAAKVAHRPVRTLRTWINRLQVTAVCMIEDRSVLVWWPDVSDRAFRHAAEPDERSA